MFTLENARALDRTLKKVSKRLFVKYWPAYRDVQGHLELPDGELCLSNPDDPDQAEVIYDHLPPKMFDKPAQCMMDETHMQAVQEAIREFKHTTLRQFLPASSIKAEKDCQPYRVDQIDDFANTLRAQLAAGDTGATAPEAVTYKDLMSHLSNHSLIEIWYQALTVDQRSPFHLSKDHVDSFLVLSTDFGQEDFNRFFDDNAVIRTQDYDVRSQAVAKAPNHSGFPFPSYRFGGRSSLTGPEVISAGSPYLKARLEAGWVYIVREEGMLPKETAVRSYRIIITDAPKLAEKWDFPKRLRAQGYSYKTDAKGDFDIGSNQLDRSGFWPHNPFDHSGPKPVPEL